MLAAVPISNMISITPREYIVHTMKTNCLVLTCYYLVSTVRLRKFSGRLSSQLLLEPLSGCLLTVNIVIVVGSTT